MDIIDYAVQQDLYLSEEGEIKKQTWADFEHNMAGGKKIFLFGFGKGTAYFFKKYNDRYHIDGILDNDEQWHGFTAGDLLAEAYGSVNEGAEIMPVSALDNYKKEEIIVIITTKYY